MKFIYKKRLEVVVDEDVWQRLHFLRKEMKKQGKRPTINNVLRYLLIETGWLAEQKFPYDL